MKTLNQKYADWSKVLIEPQSLNDARLFALETRMHEEEDIRIKEYDYMRDLMKKLIYSLEQKNIQTIEMNKVNGARSVDKVNSSHIRSTAEDNSPSQQVKMLPAPSSVSPILPNLLQTQSFQVANVSKQTNLSNSLIENSKLNQSFNLNDANISIQQRTNDILMLKRLNFLKTSLDGHSPKETTNALRLKAIKKRDERILEIWRKELEQPSVKEIIQSYTYFSF